MPRSVSPQTLRRLTYFAVIAETGSIRGAAERLGLSTPVISDALSDLEAELQVTLASRTTRRFELTESGKAIDLFARQILQLGQSALQYSQEERALSGPLAITLPVELAARWIAPKLASFQALHAEVRFTIDASDQVIDLKSSVFDLAIRTRYVRPGSPLTGLSCLPLVCVSKSDDLISEQSGDTLVSKQAIIGPYPDKGLIAVNTASGKEVRLVSSQSLAVNNRNVAMDLAIQGMGMTLLVEASAEEALSDGRLVRILPDYEFGAIALEYVFRDALPSPAAKAFVTFLETYGS